MIESALRNRQLDTCMRNATILAAVRSFVKDRTPDAALQGLDPEALAVLRGPDGVAAATPWLHAFRQPLDLYEQFRLDVLDGTAFSDDDVQKMAEATDKALRSLNQTLTAGSWDRSAAQSAPR